jgi:hypothetical protein
MNTPIEPFLPYKDNSKMEVEPPLWKSRSTPAPCDRFIPHRINHSM